MADQTVQPSVYTPTAPQVAADEARNTAVVQQLEWYLGRTNLIQDFFLKRQMDENLWVSLARIMGFPKMKVLNVTPDEESHIAQLVSARSDVIEVDPTGHFVRPIWAIRSTLELKGLPINTNPLAIQNFLESLGDSSMPSWVHIFPDLTAPIWNVVFNSFEGAGVAASKIHGKSFHGTTVSASVREESRQTMVGEAATLLDGAVPVFTPPGTPNAFFPSNPEVMQGSVGGQGPGPGHNSQTPIGLVPPYGNMPQGMMPINIGVQGMPHQGHQVGAPYGFIPSSGFSGAGYQGNGVPQHVMQRGFNGHNTYFVSYSGSPYEGPSHNHAAQQGGVAEANTSSSDPASIQQQMANVNIQGGDSTTPHPMRNVRSPGVPGGTGPRSHNNHRRSMPRHGGHHHHGNAALVLTPHEGISVAPGAQVNIAAVPQAHLGMPGTPVNAKGIPMTYVGLAHPMTNPRQPHIVMGGRMANGNMPNERRGNFGPGGKSHRNHNHHHHGGNGDGMRTGGPSRGSNGMGGDPRGPGGNKKNKKAGRNNQRQTGNHNDRHNLGSFDGKGSDQKADGAAAGSSSRDERRASVEDKKKVEPNLNSMNFPPLPGVSGDGGNANSSQGVSKGTLKATPIQSESESNVTVSPDQGPARPVESEPVIKDDIAGNVLPRAARDASVNLRRSTESNSSVPKISNSGATIAEDRLSTASSSGGSDHGTTPSGRDHNSTGHMSYAAILRKKAQDNAAKHVTRNAAVSPNLARAVNSNPSSPSQDPAAKPSSGRSADVVRRRSIGVSAEAGKGAVAAKQASAGAVDAKMGAGESSVKENNNRSSVLPASVSVWANKPRSVFEPVSAPPVAKPPQSPSAVSNSSQKSSSPALKPSEPIGEALEAKVTEQKLPVQAEVAASTTEMNGPDAPFLTEKVSTETSGSGGGSSSQVSGAKGAWAAGGPKKWVGKDQSGGSTKMDS